MQNVKCKNPLNLCHFLHFLTQEEWMQELLFGSICIMFECSFFSSPVCIEASFTVPRTICKFVLKFIYSEKATKFCEISTVDLSYVVPVKSTVEISLRKVVIEGMACQLPSRSDEPCPQLQPSLVKSPP